MKIILDTDIGSDIDDALALVLLLHLPDAELVGVSALSIPASIAPPVSPKPNPWRRSRQFQARPLRARV